MGEDGTFTAPSATPRGNIHRHHALADTPACLPPAAALPIHHFLLFPVGLAPRSLPLAVHPPPAAMAPQATPPRPPPRVGVQDMAPPGGYASIGVARNVPKSVGPRASLLMLAGALVMGGGLYRVGNFNVYRRYVAPPGGVGRGGLAARAPRLHTLALACCVLSLFCCFWACVWWPDVLLSCFVVVNRTRLGWGLCRCVGGGGRRWRCRFPLHPPADALCVLPLVTWLCAGAGSSRRSAPPCAVR